MKKFIYFSIVIIILCQFLLLDKIKIAQAADNFSLSFSTYIGGSSWENIRGVTTDPQGYIYITGGTNSADYPTTFGPAHQGPSCTVQPCACITALPNNSCSDIFVTKLTPDGKTIVWSRLIGTTGHDRAYGIKYDSTGYLFIHGRMGPNYTMTPGVVQPTFGGWGIAGVDGYGPQNGFIGKLNPSNGNIIWISYIGSASLVRDASVDELGNVYVATGYEPQLGSPWRPDQQYPAAFANAYSKTPPGGGDSVIFKINPSGTQILWGTYFGGTGQDEAAQSIRMQITTKNVYISGQTKSTDLPGTSNVFSQGRSAHGGVDYFVAKFSSDGSSLFWSAYLGGSSDEFHNTQNLAVEQSTGNVYVSPFTASANYPTTVGAFQRTFGGAYGDAAISKISSDGTQLLASTFIGGNSNDNSDGLILDSANQRIYFTGNTGSTNYPVTSNAYQSTNKGGSNEGDAFLSVMSDDLSQLLYSTYLGGSNADSCRGATVDASGNFLCGGISNSTNFPVLNALQSSNTGVTKGILVKFSPVAGDITPPVISGITSSAITSSGATINWTTNENADSQVEYGLTTSYGSQTTLNTSMVTLHSQTISGLSASTLYHYRVKSKDASNNLAVSGDYTFTTSAGGGATTVRFYAGAGDGQVINTSATAPASFSVLRSATVGTQANNTSIDLWSSSYWAASWPEISRAFFPIDTSALPDNANITNATLNLYAASVTDGDNDGNDFISIVQTSQTSPTSLTTSDFDNCGLLTPIEGSNRIDLTALSTSAYTVFTLNAAGINWISKTGYTYLGVREGHDVLNDIPSAYNRARFYASEQAGTSQDPYLEVTYTTGTDTTPPQAPTGVAVI